jgi:glutathione S-transferase
VPEFRLHCFADSGAAYKAALMLELCAARWEPVFVDYFNGATRTPEFRALNEMGEAPVLEHGDRRLSQSGVILDYLSSALSRFGAASADERREILRWMFWDNHKLTSYTATARYLLKVQDTDAADPGALAFLSRRARAALAILDTHLAARTWVASDKPTIADLSCAGYLFYDGELPYDLPADAPNVARWRDRIAALPGWKHPYDLMPGHPSRGPR